jgi:dolichyl-phosphate-mannose--protein O-mannosyl transferase
VSALIAVNVAIFVYFAPFAFGFKGPAKQMAGRRWLTRWKVHDDPEHFEFEDAGED